MMMVMAVLLGMMGLIPGICLALISWIHTLAMGISFVDLLRGHYSFIGDDGNIKNYIAELCGTNLTLPFRNMGVIRNPSS